MSTFETFAQKVREPRIFMASALGLSGSYLAKEYWTKPREIAPVYFDHIGNGCLSYFAAMVGSTIAIHAANKYSSEDKVNRDSKLTIASGLALGALSGIVAETPGISERVPVSDSKDLLFGLAGAALGSVILSYKQYKANTPFNTPQDLVPNAQQ